jgi:tetratricopeptide (TPR) repeat protein
MHRAVANAAFQLGEHARALQHLDRALAIERERGDRAAMASVMQQLGAVYATLGDPRARVHQESALALAVEIGDGPTEARTSLGLGSHHFEQGDLERAQRYYERGRALAQSLRMLRAHRIATGYLGLLHFDAGALPKAEAHLRASVVASREAGDLRLEGVFEGVRAAVLAAQDRLEESRASFVHAERLLAENAFFGDVIALHRGHLDLAEARDSRAHGHLGAALAHCARAKARIDAALATPEGGGEGKGSRSLVQKSDDARIGLRILGRAMDEALGAPV